MILEQEDKPFMSAEVCSVVSNTSAHKPFVPSEVSDTASPPPHYKNEWKSGLFHHIPALGIAALLGASLSTAVMIFVLLHSHGRDVNTWKGTWRFSAPVWLSTFSSVTTNLLTYALGVGCAISWWRKSMSRGITVSDLDHQWSCGDNFMCASGSLLHRRFNRLAVACVVTSVAAQAVAPLFQAASTMDTQRTFGLSNLEIPSLAQGMNVPGSDTEAFFKSPDLSTVLANWAHDVPINITDGSCRGECSNTLPGLGWIWACSSGNAPWGNKTHGIQSPSDWKFEVFSSNVSLTGPDENQTFLLTSTYKTERLCDAKLASHTCHMGVGIVNYPVVLNGRSLSLAPNTSMANDSLINYPDANTSDPVVHLWVNTLWASLGAKFNSSAYPEFLPGLIGEDFSSEVVSPSNAYYDYMDHSHLLGGDRDPNCTVIFRDPMPDMLQTARELLFRLAYEVGSFNSPNVLPIVWQDIYSVPAYRTINIYMYLAAAISFLGIFSVATTFCGYWKLGRTISLSPIEIAKAFNAPMLRSQDSNARSKDLVKVFRRTRIRYGEVIRVDGTAVDKEIEIPSDKEARRTLEMADPSVVRKPGQRQVFDG